jgi:hypothetical protein
MSNQELAVKKRNGAIEPLMLEKLHRMVEEACSGLSGVSISQVEMNSHIQFYDGITTDEIQKILIKSASDLISLDAPNYQYVAARLLLFSIRKQVYGGAEMPSLIDHIRNCVELGVYDDYVINEYNEEIGVEEFITIALEWAKDGLDAKTYRRKHPRQYHYDFEEPEIYIDDLRFAPYSDFC